MCACVCVCVCACLQEAAQQRRDAEAAVLEQQAERRRKAVEEWRKKRLADQVGTGGGRCRYQPKLNGTPGTGEGVVDTSPN